MPMTLVQDIQQHLAQYLQRDITLRDLDHWLVPATWDVNLRGDREAQRLGAAIELAVWECQAGDRTEDEVREMLRPLLALAAPPRGPALRHMLRSYVEGAISLDALTTWLGVQNWAGEPDAATWELATTLNRAITEFHNGEGSGEQDLRTFFRRLIGLYANDVLVERTTRSTTTVIDRSTRGMSVARALERARTGLTMHRHGSAA